MTLTLNDITLYERSGPPIFNYTFKDDYQLFYNYMEIFDVTKGTIEPLINYLSNAAFYDEGSLCDVIRAPYHSATADGADDLAFKIGLNSTLRGNIRYPCSVTGEVGELGGYDEEYRIRKIRIATTDDTKWVELESDLHEPEQNDSTWFTCSNSSEDSTWYSEPDKRTGDDYHHQRVIGRLEVLSDGKVKAYQYDGCIYTGNPSYPCYEGSDSWVTIKSTSTAIFASGDSLKLEIHVECTNFDAPWYTNEFPVSAAIGFSANFASGTEYHVHQPEMEYLTCTMESDPVVLDLDAEEFTITGLMNCNNDGPAGRRYWSFDNMTQQDIDDFLAEWDLSEDFEYSYPTNDRLSVMDDTLPLWFMKLKNPKYTHSLYDDFQYRLPYVCHYPRIVFINDDESRYIYFDHVYDTTHRIDVYTHNGFVERWEGYGAYCVDIRIRLQKTIMCYALGASSYEFYDLKEVFEVYDRITMAIGSYDDSWVTLYQHIDLASPRFSHNTSLGQTANVAIYESLPGPTPCEIEQLTIDYYMYFRDKIRNASDYNDPQSLYGMRVDKPSDEENPLKAGDTCLVIDQYNRIYWYKVKSGSQADSLPDYINISPTLYWELFDMQTSTNKIVEQYSLDGLSSTAEKIITHTQHDQTKSKGPNVQVIHNGKVKTSGFTIAIKSSTELRVSTDEVTPYTDMDINVFITPVI